MGPTVQAARNTRWLVLWPGDLPGAFFFFFFAWQPRKEGGLDLVIHFFPFVPFWVFLFGVRFRVDRDTHVCTYIRSTWWAYACWAGGNAVFCLLGGDRTSEDLYGVGESTFGLGGV